MMDITNANSGKGKGLKQLLKHLIPLAYYIGSGNQKPHYVLSIYSLSLNLFLVTMQPYSLNGSFFIFVRLL